MKFNFQGFAYLAFAALIGFTSCKKDDSNKPAPTITILSSNLGTSKTAGAAFAGGTATITVSVKADEEIKSIETFQVIGSNSTSLGATTTDFDSKTASEEIFEYSIPANASGKITLKFVAIDKKDQKTEVGYDINITSYSAVLLGAQSNAAGAYFSASTGMVYSASQASANVDKVDLSYAFLNNGGSTLISWNFRKDPSTGLTATVPAGARRTYFAASSFSAADFIAVKLPGETAFANGTASVSSASPEKISIEEGKVYAFLTQDGKKGLVHIASIAAGGLTGSVTINVKYAP